MAPGKTVTGFQSPKAAPIGEPQGGIEVLTASRPHAGICRRPPIDTVRPARHLKWPSLAAGLLIASACAGGDWPQWRGPNRDGHAAPGEPALSSLPANLAPAWRRAVGGGFASPIVIDGRLIYVDETGGREIAHCLDAANGAELWQVSYADSYRDEWGAGPRCTPVADGERIYVQSCKGEFACLAFKDGQRLWGVDFERDYGVKFLGQLESPDAATRRRGHSGAPVIVGDQIYVAVGSTNGASVVCFNKRTGRELWRAANDEAAYAALVSARLAGTDQIVAYTADALLGLGPADGRVLWRIPLRTAAKRHAVTPIAIDDNVIVSSHTLGLRSFAIRRDGDNLAATQHWANDALKISVATTVRIDGYLYGQGPDRNFICVDARTGKLIWSQPGFGEKPLVGYSSTLALGRNLLALTDDGQLVLVEATPERYTELGRQQVCGKNWSHPALVDGRLYLRDHRQLLAFDLAARSQAR